MRDVSDPNRSGAGRAPFTLLYDGACALPGRTEQGSARSSS